jgi:hypothetical protein
VVNSWSTVVPTPSRGPLALPGSPPPRGRPRRRPAERRGVWAASCLACGLEAAHTPDPPQTLPPNPPQCGQPETGHATNRRLPSLRSFAELHARSSVLDGLAAYRPPATNQMAIFGAHPIFVHKVERVRRRSRSPRPRSLADSNAHAHGHAGRARRSGERQEVTHGPGVQAEAAREPVARRHGSRVGQHRRVAFGAGERPIRQVPGALGSAPLVSPGQPLRRPRL